MLRIEDGTWTVTGSSAVNSLHLQAGRWHTQRLPKATENSNTCEVKTLSGGLFEMNASADLSDGDLLVVSDEANGQHKVLVRGAGTDSTGVESLTLVELPRAARRGSRLPTGAGWSTPARSAIA